MMRSLLAIALSLSLSALAQAPADDQSLVGKYRGHIMTNGLMMAEVGIDLVIERVENGHVTATLTKYGMRAEAGGACNGDLKMRGMYINNKLKLGGRNGGDSGSCGLRFEATRDGDKLTGTTPNGFQVELSRIP
jgi:hypothetical protein